MSNLQKRVMSKICTHGFMGPKENSYVVISQGAGLMDKPRARYRQGLLLRPSHPSSNFPARPYNSFDNCITSKIIDKSSSRKINNQL